MKNVTVSVANLNHFRTKMRRTFGLTNAVLYFLIVEDH
jgi:hypothetical protein